MNDLGGVTVSGFVSAHSGRPLVYVAIDGQEFQTEVDEARGLARDLIEAASQAVSEASLLAYLVEELELHPERAATALGQMRTWRADRWGQPEG